MPARIAMIAMTTRSSIRVKPRLHERDVHPALAGIIARGKGIIAYADMADASSGIPMNMGKEPIGSLPEVWRLGHGANSHIAPFGKGVGEAMSSSPREWLWNGDEDVATPLRAGAVSRCVLGLLTGERGCIWRIASSRRPLRWEGSNSPEIGLGDRAGLGHV